MTYKVYDSANGFRVELGSFNTLEEAQAFQEEAQRRIQLTMNFLGKRTLHMIEIAEEEGS